MAHPLREKVTQLIQQAPVVVFMKGAPDFPLCGFSRKACETLRQAGASEILGIDVLSDDPLWDALEEFTEWPTVPQVFVHGKFIGGCDIVVEMFEQGELQELLLTTPAASGSPLEAARSGHPARDESIGA